MMSLMLEDFEIVPTPPSAILPEQVSKINAEAEKMSAYEQGYQAGWDDAVQAQLRDQARISADFARNLQDLSFTFFEARTHVIQSMEPLMMQMLETVFPSLMAEALGGRLIDEMSEMVAQSADNPIELLISPISRPALETLMQGSEIPAFRIKEEPTLAEGQAFLRMGHVERQIDLSTVTERMTTAIRSLFLLNQRNLKHAG